MTFFELITAAIADINKHGYDSQERLNKWTDELIKSLNLTLTPTSSLDETLRRHLSKTYERMIQGGQLIKIHPGVSVYDLNRVKPRLHAELQRRIMASAHLIKMNRNDAINTTVQRFAGWATSIPSGGTKMTDVNEIKNSLSKSLKQLPYNERRVMIDQSHKFVGALNDIVAEDQGAIAAKWRSHWRQPGYQFREDHKDRDGRYYAIKDSWAVKQGLINKGAGFTDDMTIPGEEIFCRCAYSYVYSLRKLPDEMLTRKGREKLDAIKDSR